VSGNPARTLWTCGSPTHYQIDATPDGGYELLVGHVCPMTPPAVLHVVWGPFEDLDAVVRAVYMAYPFAVPADGTIPLPRRH